MDNKNNIIVISGPSGSGKSTLIKKLFDKYQNLKFSISHTTRTIRENEKEGIDYHYISNEKFKSMIIEKEFVEWAKVYLNYYGTCWKEVISKSVKDDIIILDLDIQGARIIKEKFDEALLILISPPSLSELRKRLISRENREDNDIQTRLQIAISELKEYDIYDYIIINDNLDDSFARLENILLAFKNKKQFIVKDLFKIIKNWKNN